MQAEPVLGSERRTAPGLGAPVVLRWVDPHSGRDTDCTGSLEEILPEGLIVVRRSGSNPALLDRGQVARLLVSTVDGPFVLHTRVARAHRQGAVLLRPLTDPRLQERRRAPRVPNPPVRLLVTGAGKSWEARVLDLSVRGVRWVAPRAVAAGARLALELELNQQHRIALGAIVIATAEAPDGECICRCRFEHLSLEAENELALFVSSQLPRPPERVARLQLSRLPARAAILLLREYVEGEPFEVRLIELGVSAARFVSPRYLEVGTQLRLELAMPDTPLFAVDAEVRASGESGPDGRVYDARLLDISEFARRTILAHVVRFLVTDRLAHSPFTAGARQES
ncbi:MAG: hypothetical protein KatS3mg061_0829 [Dehalococcoidia bacterium]|nr:MAG: hypothetical protein KatS3mg061_0829 [Dehalococcoidia bacterium]